MDLDPILQFGSQELIRKKISGPLEDQFGNHLAAAVEQYLQGKVGDVFDIRINFAREQVQVSFVCDLPMFRAVLTAYNARELPEPYLAPDVPDVTEPVHRKIRFSVSEGE